MLSRALIGAAITTLIAALPEAAAQERPSLVVLVSVDQLGSEYLTRWERLLDGGLGALRRRGAYYPNGVHAQANTATGPGHASIVTGTWPELHGVVSNLWYDPADGALTYCVQDSKYGLGPGLMMMPTIGDQLRWATGGQAKVVSIGIKDRVAVLMGGQRPTLAAWYDDTSGAFTAGRWYEAPPPPWLAEVNAGQNATKSFGVTWDRLLPGLDYQKHATADDMAYEGPIPGLGRTFPHVYGKGLEGPGEKWFDVYPATPALLDTLFTMVHRAIDEEQLGKRGTTDLLLVGVSTLDYAGHYWGPHSQETLDVLLRIDRALAGLMKHVDERIGGGRTLWVLTADHGVATAPELAKSLGLKASRVPGRDLEELVNAALRPLARKNQPALKVQLIDPPLVFLNHDDPGADRRAAQRAAAKALRSHPAIIEAWASADVDRFSEPFRSMYRRVLYPGREPDLMYRGRPGDLIHSKHGTGSNHGSPYTYDTHVPIFVSGPRVRRSEDSRPYPITAIAPTIAAILGITPPAGALEKPLPIVQ